MLEKGCEWKEGRRAGAGTAAREGWLRLAKAAAATAVAGLAWKLTDGSEKGGIMWKGPTSQNFHRFGTECEQVGRVVH